MNEENTPDTRLDTKEGAFSAPPDLDLTIDDNTLVDFIDAYIKKSRAYFDEEKKLKQKRKENKKYYFGRQLESIELKNFEKNQMVLDNVIKEQEDILRPLVLSRLPDIVVNPGQANDENKQKTAEAVTRMIHTELDDRTLKRILTRAFRDHPIYYTAVIKYRWDQNKGQFGGVRWEVVHPENILVDSTATENRQEQMRIIIHFVEKSIKDWTMLFPKKEEQIKEYARKKGKFSQEDEKSMAVSIKVAEVWFDYSKKTEDFDPENPEFEHLSGVCWKLGKTILDKRKNPNWDWEGEESLFINGQPVPEEMIPQLALLGNQISGIERQKTFRNFFGKPRKPFIFFGFEQYGEMAYDETSRIEENRVLQDNYDYRGRQIMRMIDQAQGKHVFSTLSGLTKETVGEMDLDDWSEDIVIDGDIRQVHAFIAKEQPSQAMFGDLQRTRERMLEKIQINSAVRGEIQTDTATTTQIAREAGFTAADELSDLTVVDVSVQMAEAQLHMMKLRYTPEHFQMVLGKAGAEAFDTLTADAIEDGMEVMVTASGTDKLQAERQATQEAQLGLIDPVNFYKDTGRDDPERRAEMLFLFQTAPELYFKRFAQGQDTQGIADEAIALSQQALAGTQGQSGQQSDRGIPSQSPVGASPQNTGNIATTPAGSPRNLVGRAGQMMSSLFNR